MAVQIHDVTEAFQAGQTLAVADQVLIDPEPGTLEERVEGLLEAIKKNGGSGDRTCKTLLQLGMNFVGRDAEIVGYSAEEAQGALKLVLTAIDGLDGEVK